MMADPDIRRAFRRCSMHSTMLLILPDTSDSDTISRCAEVVCCHVARMMRCASAYRDDAATRERYASTLRVAHARVSSSVCESAVQKCCAVLLQCAMCEDAARRVIWL